MDIQSYLDKHSLTQDGFAEMIGVSQGAVWQWLNGRTKVSPKHFLEIERKTGGEVTREDLRPDLFSRKGRVVKRVAPPTP
jgi:DNA-binding transcriptional regulator YdaS (Cro superfamily)